MVWAYGVPTDPVACSPCQRRRGGKGTGGTGGTGHAQSRLHQLLLSVAHVAVDGSGWQWIALKMWNDLEKNGENIKLR